MSEECIVCKGTGKVDVVKIKMELEGSGWTKEAEIIARDEYIDQLEAINAELMESLKKIRDMDKRSMYERCPDCWTDSCTETKTCKDVPYSQIGKAVNEVLAKLEKK